MHRAEKSSSKICRAREVEKAQELHRKKIDGVKSYLSGIIPKPTASRTAAACRPRPARSMLGSFSSVACIRGCPPSSAEDSLASSGNLSQQLTEKDGDGLADMDLSMSDDGSRKAKSDQQNQPMDEFQQSLAKMNEFRGVAPVPGLGSVPPNKNALSSFPPPPAEARRKTLNGSFRARRLKEIKADNMDVFQRIRKSVSHYRNDDLRRDWQQNLSYLSSITEYPLTIDTSAFASSPHKPQVADDDGRNCFGPPPRRPSFLSTANRADALPSIALPVVAHRIKSIPTSPKKLQLNMTPAFRSLRKAMPQQPSLPPISSAHSFLNASGSTDPGSTMKPELLTYPRYQNTYSYSAIHDDRCTDSPSGRVHTSRASTVNSTTAFIGDLHGKQAESDSGDAKYQLLKTGRFVGGTYLVLTVFFGDGVTNPYGFDVFAYHRELQCEYKLSVTKEMTHELLDKSSSTSLAAATEAAAGTNLSMQEIARRICDHINFAVLGADQGEMIFLVPTAASKNDQTMRFDSSPTLVAFCVHQTVELDALGEHNSNSRVHNSNNKQKVHIFASSCPPKRYPTNPTSSIMASKNGDTTGLTICFQLMENLPRSRSMSSVETISPCTSVLEVEVGADDIYNNILCDSWQDQPRVLSLDRMVVAAIRHLHVISVPSGDGIDTLRNELILNSHVNSQLEPCASRTAVIMTTLEKKRSIQRLPRPASQVLAQSANRAILLQTGLVWRNAYLVAEVALDITEHTTSRGDWNEAQWQDQRQLIRDVDCSLLVSVFNSNSGHSSFRRLSPKKISAFVARLDTLSSKAKSSTCLHSENIREQHIFAGQFLTMLQLDVNLFGQEVIVFPTLEHVCPPTEADANRSFKKEPSQSQGRRRLSENEEAEASGKSLDEEFLPRKSSWVSDNISEGDEGFGSDEYDDGETEDFNAGVQQFGGFEDEDDEDDAEASYSSHTNQDEAELDAALKSLHDAAPLNECEDTPEQDEATASEEMLVIEKLGTAQGEQFPEPSVHRRWKQGQKIDGRFCLLQGKSDQHQAKLVLAIGAAGSLDILSESAVSKR